jgi:hypothetical protein
MIEKYHVELVLSFGQVQLHRNQSLRCDILMAAEKHLLLIL